MVYGHGAERVRVGVHTSIAGGVEHAALRAREMGCDTFQMFSANPRGWKAAELTRRGRARFREACAAGKLAPVVIHDNYLINLATVDPILREKSINAFRGELERALGLGADYLVTHPGSARGQSASDGIAAFIQALRQAAKGLRLDGLTVLIENTAGQGAALGRTFEEVAEIIAGAGRDLPVGACIDTAHTFQAGYPLHTPEGLAKTLKQLDTTVGIGNVRIIHANDSKTEFASHADRHEHIGKGRIGREAFGRIVRHPKLRAIPFICETPIDRPGDDKRNLRMMRRLAGEQKAVGRRP